MKIAVVTSALVLGSIIAVMACGSDTDDATSSEAGVDAGPSYDAGVTAEYVLCLDASPPADASTGFNCNPQGPLLGAEFVAGCHRDQWLALSQIWECRADSDGNIAAPAPPYNRCLIEVYREGQFADYLCDTQICPATASPDARCQETDAGKPYTYACNPALKIPTGGPCAFLDDAGAVCCHSTD